jgi:iron complex transport system permease protein
VSATTTRTELVPKSAVTSRSRLAPVFAIATLLLLASLLTGVAAGAVHITPREFLAILMGNHATGATDYHTILFYIRLPRVVTAGVIGAALALAGVLFQGLFRNPMAEPYVLGSSGGAAFGAALGMFLFPHAALLGFGAAAVFAFLGAVFTITVVYMVARVGGRTPTVALLLSGFAVSMILNESSSVLVYVRDELSFNARNLTLWLHGSVAFSEWSQLIFPAAMLLLGGLFSFRLRRVLNVFALGEDYARQLGINVELSRAGIVAVGSVLTASAVLLGGIIGFVGLLVPHVVRLIVGPEHGRLLALSAICGASYLILADTFARTVVAPSELPVGLITACLGGPVLIYLLRRSKQEYVV